MQSLIPDARDMASEAQLCGARISCMRRHEEELSQELARARTCRRGVKKAAASATKAPAATAVTIAPPACGGDVRLPAVVADASLETKEEVNHVMRETRGHHEDLPVFGEGACETVGSAFEVGERHGKNAYGMVYKVVHNRNGVEVAIKAAET